MLKRTIENVREFFRQPKGLKLKVVPPIALDLSKFHDSIGYFFEEIVAFDKDTPEYQALKKGTVYIGANEAKGAPEDEGYWDKTVIQVYFDEKETTIQTIQANLEKIGIKTEVISE